MAYSNQRSPFKRLAADLDVDRFTFSVPNLSPRRFKATTPSFMPETSSPTRSALRDVRDPLGVGQRQEPLSPSVARRPPRSALRTNNDPSAIRSPVKLRSTNQRLARRTPAAGPSSAGAISDRIRKSPLSPDNKENTPKRRKAVTFVDDSNDLKSIVLSLQGQVRRLQTDYDETVNELRGIIRTQSRQIDVLRRRLDTL
uniref:ARAD1C19998p n=1 Tax=Blastobotrys adeninivorans TaxID=409370 RepID=A0A060T100_BLAAD